jgi:hypothetical protein
MYLTKKWDKKSLINSVPPEDIFKSDPLFKNFDDIWLVYYEYDGKEIVEQIELGHIIKSTLNAPLSTPTAVVMQKLVDKKNIDSLTASIRSGYISLAEVHEKYRNDVEAEIDKILQEELKEIAPVEE